MNESMTSALRAERSKALLLNHASAAVVGLNPTWGEMKLSYLS